MESVTPESFVSLKNRLENSLLPPKKLYVGSGGGDLYSGLAIGQLIYDYQLDIHVVDFCASSCANFLFPAGKRKTLGRFTIVMYHGNTQQISFQNVVYALEQVDGDISQLPSGLDLGIEGKEVHIKLSLDNDLIMSEAQKQVYRYLGWPFDLTAQDTLKAAAKAEAAFYKKLNVDQKIGVYGQQGVYFDTYKSYQYDGFYYSLADMKTMGLGNIRVVGGTWAPEHNSMFTKIYLVKLNAPDTSSVVPVEHTL